MAARTEQATTIIKGDTAANLASSNPLLWLREIIYETDTGKFKFGDGEHRWNDLEYSGTEHDVLATTTTKGMMSAADKAKLDGIAASANNYTLPIAAADTLGGIKIGENLSIADDGTLSASTPVSTGTVTGSGNVITALEVDANNNINITKGITALTGSDILDHNDSGGSHHGLLYGLQRNKAYVVGDLVRHEDLPSWMQLKCTTAGTTAAVEPGIVSTEGTNIVDGTVVWTVTKILDKTDVFSFEATSDGVGVRITDSTISNLATTKSLDFTNGSTWDNIRAGNIEANGYLKGTGVTTLQRSHAYILSDIVYHASLPSWAYLECTTAGTTAATEPNTITSSCDKGDTITDGTVTWTVKKVGSGGSLWKYDTETQSIIPKTEEEISAADIDSDNLTVSTIVNNLTSTLSSTVSNHTTTIDDHTTTLSTLSTTVSGHTDTLNDHTNSLSSLNTTVSGHTDTLNDHTNSLSNLNTTVSGHTTTIGDHTTTLSTLSTTVSGHTTSISNLNTTVAGHTTTINSHTTKLASLPNAITYGTYDLTAGSTALATGNIYLMYE